MMFFQYLKLEPPTNSRMMEVGGISLSETGRKKWMNFSRRWASEYSGQFLGTEARMISAWVRSTANSMLRAELNITSAVS